MSDKQEIELVDCPYCLTREGGRYGYCGYCQENRKVNAHHLKWLEDWRKVCQDVEIEMRAKMERNIDQKLDEWSAAHPEPPKF